jgi:hypothetical protein
MTTIFTCLILIPLAATGLNALLMLHIGKTLVKAMGVHHD